MENILNNVPSWVTWVFSGIGCLVLTWLGAYLFKKTQGTSTKINKKSTVKGNDNIVIQDSDNSSINIGK